MSNFIPWNSQSLTDWGQKHARGKFIELDGRQTHYIDHGQGEPVILIHGFFFDTHLWDLNLAALAEHYKVFVIDLWGFGYSTRGDFDVGYPLYAHQLHKFMDALGIEKATLIGQSMGGGTIIKFSETNRERINKIVLVEPSVLHQEVPQLGKIALLPGVGEFLYSINSNFMRKFTLKNTFIHNMNHITEAYFDQLTRFQKVRGTTENLLKILRKGFFYTLEEEVHQLGKFNLPNLVVGGRQTKGILLEKTEEVHRILTGSDLEILDQAGHCPNIDQPEKFNQLVLAFLTG